MRNKSTMKRTVFVYLLLHTAIVAMLVLLLMRNGLPAGNPFLMAFAAASSAFFALYTTHTIIRSVNDEIASRERGLSQISGHLQAMMATMREYEKELGRRTAAIRQCGRDLELRAGRINEYSVRINELVSVAKAIDDNAQSLEDGGERKGE